MIRNAREGTEPVDDRTLIAVTSARVPRRTGWSVAQTASLGVVVMLVGFLAWLAFFSQLGSTSLFENAEPLFAQASREMLSSGDWITPRLNGVPRFDKPILMYWLMAGSYLMFGVTEWAIRFPSALAAGLLMFGVFAALWAWNGRAPRGRLGIAALGAAITALNLEMIFWARVGVADMVLSACFGGALLTFFRGYVRSSNGAYLLSFALMGLAVLAKGPIGAVLPVAIAAGFLYTAGTWRRVLSEIPLRAGMALFLAITLPWYGLAFAANGFAFIESFLGYHNIYRFTHVVGDQSGPWYFYAVVVAVFFAPWSMFLPAALAGQRFWDRAFWSAQPREQHLGLLAALWFLGVFVFFSLATTKLHNYVLPLVPAAAILVAQYAQTLASPGQDRSRSWTIAGMLSVGASLGLGLLLWWGPVKLAHARDSSLIAMPAFLGDLVPSAAAREYLLETGRYMERLGVHYWALAVCVASACAKMVAIVKRRPLWLVAVNVPAWILFLTLVLAPIATGVDLVERRPVQSLALAASRYQRAGEPLFVVGLPKPSVIFYSQRPVRFLSDMPDLIRESARTAVPSALVISEARLWSGPTPSRVLLQAAGAHQLVRLVLPEQTTLQATAAPKDGSAH